MKSKQPIKNNNCLIKAICGGLLGAIPLTAFSSVALPVTQSNSHPTLLSEAPSNPGSATSPGTIPSRTTPLIPPLPEQQQPPSATVVPVNGKVNIKLVNQTYTNITYQVIGETKPRTLAGRSEITLQNLPTPINIMFQRPDRGLLRVSPQSSEPGMLEATLTETTDLGIDRLAMTIQRNGNVILN